MPREAALLPGVAWSGLRALHARPLRLACASASAGPSGAWPSTPDTDLVHGHLSKSGPSPPGVTVLLVASPPAPMGPTALAPLPRSLFPRRLPRPTRRRVPQGKPEAAGSPRGAAGRPRRSALRRRSPAPGAGPSAAPCVRGQRRQGGRLLPARPGPATWGCPATQGSPAAAALQEPECACDSFATEEAHRPRAPRMAGRGRPVV